MYNIYIIIHIYIVTYKDSYILEKTICTNTSGLFFQKESRYAIKYIHVGTCFRFAKVQRSQLLQSKLHRFAALPWSCDHLFHHCIHR